MEHLSVYCSVGNRQPRCKHHLSIQITESHKTKVYFKNHSNVLYVFFYKGCKTNPPCQRKEANLRKEKKRESTGKIGEKIEFKWKKRWKRKNKDC